MVFTIRVVITGNGHAEPTRGGKQQSNFTRRGLLGAAALSAATLGGCGIFDSGPDQPPAPDPLQPVLDEAVALAAAYDRAGLAQPGLAKRLTPLGADHRAHIAALSTVIGKAAPSGAPSASAATAGDAAAVLSDMRAAERAAQKTAVAACRTAPAERAALVGSIAACRATHAEALR